MQQQVMSLLQFLIFCGPLKAVLRLLKGLAEFRFVPFFSPLILVSRISVHAKEQPGIAIALCHVTHQDFVHYTLLLACQKLKIKKRALFKSLPEKLRLYVKFQNILRLKKNLSENSFVLEYFFLSEILSSKLRQ